jgi:hypothetical protein
VKISCQVYTKKLLLTRSRQTQTIEPSFLPSLPTTSLTVAKKADLAIAFSPYDHDIGPVIQSYLSRNPGSTLSQMQDAYTSSIPLICGLEVKQAGGDSNEGLTQLAIWTTAGLEKVEQLQRRNPGLRRSGMIQPIVGIVVVGHTWEFYIVWPEENGRRVSRIPPCVGYNRHRKAKIAIAAGRTGSACRPSLWNRKLLRHLRALQSDVEAARLAFAKVLAVVS